MASHGGAFAIPPGAAQGLHFLVVEARYYEALADEQLRGAAESFAAAGATFDRISVPGALEIPAAVMFALNGRTHYDGFVALGCVIRGETTHYEIVSNESARALMDISVRHAAAIGNGILTVENDRQAWARARVTEQNKGGGAATAAIAMALLKTQLGAS